MKISIIGAGHVGLVTAACLAEQGNQVVCVDADQQKVDQINRAELPFYEEHLEELLQNNLSVRLSAKSELSTAVAESDVSLITVGTPFLQNDIDLRSLKQVTQEIGSALKNKTNYHVVIVKSTTVPGTTEDVVLPLLQDNSGKTAGTDFGVGMNPEFLREGTGVEDFMNPDRIVLGGIDRRTIDIMEALYGGFKDTAMVNTTPRTAEMIKYASNSLLATMISFSNELANLCTDFGGMDITDVMEGVHLDKRLMPSSEDKKRIRPGFLNYLQAGCGFGGSCFPKDVKALIAQANKHGTSPDILNAAMKVNELQPWKIFDLLYKHFAYLKALNIAVLGLAFKTGTDDMRESPAIPIVKELVNQRANIKAYDPVAEHEARQVFGGSNIQYCQSIEQTISQVEVIVLLTANPEFNQIPELLTNVETQPVLIDGRRMLDKTTVSNYEGIGL